MRLLIFDPFHGAAGDMITAALLDLGADRERVMDVMASVVGEPDIEIVDRAGIKAVKVNIRAETTGRSLEQVLEKVRTAVASPEVIDMAIRVFHRIAAAEERIHGECTHFHEVGADDAIADILGACTAFFSLNIDGAAVLPIALGGGMMPGSHGTYPAPSPATLEILKDSGIQVRYGLPEDGELCTPTGAALLAEFSAVYGTQLREGGIIKVGYGAGSRDSPAIPNVLRAVILEYPQDLPCDLVDVLETNVDDVDGEMLSAGMQKLMESGARDVSLIPCLMKKGRSGFLVRVVSTPDKSDDLAASMAREIGTLGVRCTPSVHRFVAARSQELIEAEIKGERRRITVKYANIGDRIFSIKAEFDQVSEWARELGMPVRDVKEIVENKARNILWKRS
jgi:uncharacterized protein (TIGR00299 family) protein